MEEEAEEQGHLLADERHGPNDKITVLTKEGSLLVRGFGDHPTKSSTHHISSMATPDLNFCTVSFCLAFLCICRSAS